MRRPLTLLIAALSLRCTLVYPVSDLTGGDPGAAPMEQPEGPRQTAIILVQFAGGPSLMTDAGAVRETVFGSVSEFIREASYGKHWLAGDVYGPLTLTWTGPCALDAMADAADAELAREGFDPSRYQHVIYLHRDSDCPAHLAWDVDARRGWIRSGLPDAAWGHLIGHQLGLAHAQSLECGGASLRPLGDCAVNDSYDLFDVMGSGIEDPANDDFRWGHPSAPAKERLGWLDASAIEEISEGVTTIVALERPGAKVLAIPRPNLDQQRFYVELRRPIGFDDGRAQQPDAGVVVHLVTPDFTVLLDGTPMSSIGPRDWLDASLNAGDSIVDPEGGLTITVQSIADDSATIEVRHQDPNPEDMATPLKDALHAWPDVVQSGSPITVDFDASQIRTAADWIGLYRADGASNDPMWWASTQGRPSGTLSVDAPDWSGPYEFHYYRGEGEDELVARSNAITIPR